MKTLNSSGVQEWRDSVMMVKILREYSGPDEEEEEKEEKD